MKLRTNMIMKFKTCHIGRVLGSRYFWLGNMGFVNEMQEMLEGIHIFIYQKYRKNVLDKIKFKSSSIGCVLGCRDG